jgi:hypothetical protein
MFSKRFLLEKGVKREDLDEQSVTVESPGSALAILFNCVITFNS